MPSNPYLFYEIMNYPLPRQREFFSYRHSDGIWGSAFAEWPSWRAFDEQYTKQCTFLEQRSWLWKTIPFLESVYVCDKLSFNAQGDTEKIDLFLVSNVWRMWHVWLWSSMFSLYIKILYRLKQSEYVLSINFIVARDTCDIQWIKLVPHDPYLIYRLAHLVPIYQQFDQHELNIRKENKWMQYYLPDHPLEQTIFLDIEKQHGQNRIRKKNEHLGQWVIGDFRERLIRTIAIPLLLWWRSRQGIKGIGMIIARTMLKLHYEKREAFALKWKIANK